MIAPAAKFIYRYAGMKNILKTCATAMTKIRCFLERNNRFIAAAAIFCSVSGLAAGTNNAVVPAPGLPLAWIRTSADKTHFVCNGTDNSFVPWGFNYDHDGNGGREVRRQTAQDD
jgi:hypothetical protein